MFSALIIHQISRISSCVSYLLLLPLPRFSLAPLPRCPPGSPAFPSAIRLPLSAVRRPLRSTSAVRCPPLSILAHPLRSPDRSPGRSGSTPPHGLPSSISNQVMSAPGNFGHRFWSMPAGHSGSSWPPLRPGGMDGLRAGERRMTLDSPCLGVSCLEPTPGGTLWPLSDYPCVQRARSSA
jgi:hypothetical protein